MAPTPSSENGPAAPELAADAHGCIMVRVGISPPEYMSLGTSADWRVPLGSSDKREYHDCQ